MGELTKLIETYCKNKITRFHMPGHKGNAPILKKLGAPYDITEIKDADVLFYAEGVLARLEDRYSDLYQSTTVLSAGGSTLCIQAMLALAKQQGDTILVARNSHVAFINTCALLDLKPIWITSNYDSSTGLLQQPTANQIELALQQNPQVHTVYITSPDYMGLMADISAISKVCHQHQAKLIVDSAHGAHLKFTSEDLHPITLGADLCCCSAHKTLPVLTGGALLHAKGYSSTELKSKMALFGSTSPSYLILQSLDYCADYLEQQAKEDFQQLEEEREYIASICQQNNLKLLGQDPTKWTVDGFTVGQTGEQLTEHFREYKIEPEYTNYDHTVFMVSPFNSSTDFARLDAAINSVTKKTPLQHATFSFPESIQLLTPREAVFSATESLSIFDAIGKVCAENKITCPPGIPIITAGEQLTYQHCDLLKNSGILTINVVK